MTAVTSVWIQ